MTDDRGRCVPVPDKAPSADPPGRRVLVVLSGVLAAAALTFALLVPPFGGRDEPVHFLRAWHVATGHLAAQPLSNATTCTGEQVDTGLGDTFPRELVDGIAALMRDGIFATDHTAFLDHIGDPAPGGPGCVVDFRSSAVYSPVPYLPAAIAVVAGRAAGASTLAILWLARVLAAAVAIALIARAAYLAGKRWWLIAALAGAPVMLFQLSVVSADTVTLAQALHAVALAVALAEGRPRTRAAIVETALVLGALALSKPPYFLLVLALIPALTRRREWRRTLGIGMLGALALAAGWNAYANSAYVPPEDAPMGYAYHDIDPGEQLQDMLGAPWRFVAAVGRTIPQHGGRPVADTMIMVAGYEPATAWALLPGVALLLVTLTVGRVDRLLRATLLVVALAVATAVFALAYMGWNAVGAPRIDAFQGRYLFPSLALVVFAAATARMPQRWVPPARATSVVLLAATWIVIVLGVRNAFYG